MSLITLEIRANLITLYNEKHRHYHNTDHIYDCLTKLEQYATVNKIAIRDYYKLEAAIWFHDAVYNPRSKKNEENISPFWNLTDEYMMFIGIEECGQWLLNKFLWNNKFVYIRWFSSIEYEYRFEEVKTDAI